MSMYNVRRMHACMHVRMHVRRVCICVGSVCRGFMSGMYLGMYEGVCMYGYVCSYAMGTYVQYYGIMYVYIYIVYI